MIDTNKYEHPTRTLATTPPNPMGGENIYTWFEYISQTIFSHTQAQVKGLKIADTINVIERIDGTTGNIYLLLLPSLNSI